MEAPIDLDEVAVEVEVVAAAAVAAAAAIAGQHEEVEVDLVLLDLVAAGHRPIQRPNPTLAVEVYQVPPRLMLMVQRQ